jgi:hypothetical protein
LFANGKVICFGYNVNGMSLGGTNINISGSGGLPLVSTPYAEFHPSMGRIVGITATSANSCFIECSANKVVCFGPNTMGQLGQGLSAAIVLGDDNGEVSSTTAIAMDTTKVATPLFITIITFNYSWRYPTNVVPGSTDVVFSACQTFYVVSVVGAYEVYVGTYGASIAAGVLSGVGSSTVSRLPLKERGVTFMSLRLAGSGQVVEYTVAFRRLLPTSVIAGTNHACLLTADDLTQSRLTCWGV